MANQLSEMLGYGRDVAQGASNAIAGNVSAPVDGIAWLLRKAGLDVGEPVGGSDWMARKGYTRQPQNALAGMVGETLGMAGPMAIGAKAPQVANALNTAGHNLANAPRMFPGPGNAQRGAVVFHGSPHKFDAFDMSKIGTGEGAQAYGHGLYFAENPGVAASYQKQLATQDIFVDGKPVFQGGQKLGTTGDGHIDGVLQTHGGDIDAAIKSVKHEMAQFPMLAEPLKAELAKLQALSGRVRAEKAGNLYKVDLPDEHIAKMLDWDKPVSDAQRVPLSQAAMRDFGSGLSGTSGEHLYKEVLFNFKNHPDAKNAAIKWLRDNGAPGIRYLDQGSRGTGTGTSNYVVFDDKLPKILERNGQKR